MDKLSIISIFSYPNVQKLGKYICDLGPLKWLNETYRFTHAWGWIFGCGFAPTSYLPLPHVCLLFSQKLSSVWSLVIQILLMCSLTDLKLKQLLTTIFKRNKKHKCYFPRYIMRCRRLFWKYSRHPEVRVQRVLLAWTYLQPHYGNGVFGNVYLSAGQH